MTAHEIKNRLRELTQGRGKNKEVAAEIGITSENLSSYKSGRKKMGEEMRERLSAYLRSKGVG